MTGIYQDGTSSYFAIYPYGEIVMSVPPAEPYYISWTPSNLSGSFSIGGSTYRFQDYGGYFSDFSGTITSSAFTYGQFTYLETNASRVQENAFYYCRSLISISFSKCKSLDRYAFYSCNSLSKVYLPECTSIADYAFVECSLSSVVLPMCEYIGGVVFEHCSKIKKISLPRCSYIGAGAFIECYSLSSVSLPVCEYIGSQAFHKCSSLSKIDLPLCSYIGDWAFSSTSIWSISLPECLYIGERVFYSLGDLVQINLPKCSYIGSDAFYNCGRFYSITLGYSGVCELPYSNAFYGTKISNGWINVPSSLVSAYKSARNWSYFSSRINPINN